MRTQLSAMLLVLAVSLAACTNQPEPSNQVRREARVKKAQEKLATPPATRTYTLGAGQLLVMEAPVSDISGFVDYQRCFIWRDQEFQSATISCPQPPEVSLQP